MSATISQTSKNPGAAAGEHRLLSLISLLRFRHTPSNPYALSTPLSTPPKSSKPEPFFTNPPKLPETLDIYQHLHRHSIQYPTAPKSFSQSINLLPLLISYTSPSPTTGLINLEILLDPYELRNTTLCTEFVQSF
ncbi:hypothetical protein TWF970_001139 [Orbilia oligospora]|uniref:Uncharacterized protein n=1 Tax=Orbilia oligospora TaxID=2813651 RepID=A0A7C8VIN2_ORBOL|nr:hypothetical protein TWF970_001139 [Orbilia oligospora]